MYTHLFLVNIDTMKPNFLYLLGRSMSNVGLLVYKEIAYCNIQDVM